MEVATEVAMAAETDAATEVVKDVEAGEDLVGLEGLEDLEDLEGLEGLSEELEELEELEVMALTETVLGTGLEAVEEMEEGRVGEAKVGV